MLVEPCPYTAADCQINPAVADILIISLYCYIRVIIKYVNSELIINQHAPIQYGHTSSILKLF